MKDYSNRQSTPQKVQSLNSIWLLFHLLVLELSNGNFQVVTCEISETTESIELKLSGIIEGVNKLAVLKFQSNPIRLNNKYKFGMLGNYYIRYMLWSC